MVLPRAIFAKLDKRDRKVWVVDGKNCTKLLPTKEWWFTKQEIDALVLLVGTMTFSHFHSSVFSKLLFTQDSQRPPV